MKASFYREKTTTVDSHRRGFRSESWMMPISDEGTEDITGGN